MCAPDKRRMDDNSLYRIGSPSPTLVDSDYGQLSPTDAFCKAKEQMFGQTPVFQNVDSTPWIRLDALHPKLLQELRRGYDIPDWDRKRPRTKGAAKIKAWVRQNSVSFVLRFRQKINDNHDEVIDAEIVTVSTQHQSHVTELPSDHRVLEMPDTCILEAPNNRAVDGLTASPAIELPTDIGRQESLTSNHITDIDTLPRYEPAGIIAPYPLVEQKQNHANQVEELLSASLSGFDLSLSANSEDVGSSITSATDLTFEHEDHGPRNNTISDASSQTQKSLAGLGADLDETKQIRQQNVDQEVESLVMTLRQRLSEQDNQQAELNNVLKDFKIVRKTRYETETDIEPPSPSGTPKARSLRLKTSLTSLRRKKPGTNTKIKRELPDTSSSSDEDTEDEIPTRSRGVLSRRKVGPRKTPVSAGKEAILSALLQAQSEILGSRHRLSLIAKRKYPPSAKDWQQRRMTRLIIILRETEVLARASLGEKHVRTETFSADLKTFESLVGRVFCSNVDALVEQMEDQMSSPSSSPTTSEPKHEDSQNLENGLAVIQPKPVKAGNKLDVETFPKTKIEFRQIVEPSAMIMNPSDISFADQNTFNYFPRQTPPRAPIAIFTKLIVDAIIDVLMGILLWLRRNFGTEPPVEPGKARVRWTCSCGEELYDDFIEKVPGAARRLELFLNRPRIHVRGGDSPTSSPTSPYGTSGGSSFSGTRSTNSSWTSQGSIGQGPPNEKGEHNSQSPSGGSNGNNLPRFLSSFHPHRPDPPYLLACASEDKYTTKMTHIDVSRDHITSDMKLAYALREHYSNVNRRWWRSLRLRGLSSIEFVQFELHHNRFADIRKCPDVPPLPPGPVGAQQNFVGGEYEFEADTMPPIGSKLLLHLFKHPEDYDRELMAYLRIPKRTAGRLQWGVGWGLNLVEDFLAERVAVMIGSLVFFASVVFAAAWACKRNDIQGAFGVAQWISGGAVFVCGWVQLYVG